ncbi:uncharacterized protein [Salminus brasiliensis]|uniref:uncharacterized protein isoform X2 n=1 Tax=Salminus brasiliensis TaxID=930266 RepID=UPI003B831CB1
MTVKILLFIPFYLMSVSGGASREVTGYPGGGVLIKCKYERSYTANLKYFCKSSWTTCDDQIRTDVSNEWKNIGRFSLFDNTRAAEFWVLIRELTVEDSRTYQCAVDIEMWPDDHTPVELKIQEDLDQKKSITVNSHVGGSVNISCKYPQSSSSKPRFLCRRVGSADCNYKASVKESRRWIKEGKFSLYDDRAQQTFTVSIDNLTNEDSGEYWCGAESDWESDHGYKVYITQIKLTVTAAVPHSTFSPSSVQTQPTHLPNFSSTVYRFIHTSSQTAPRSVHPEPTHQLTRQDQPVRSSTSPPRTSSPLSTEVTSSSTSKTPDVPPQSSTPISLQTTKAITLSTSKTTVSSSSAAGVAHPASSVITILAVILMLVLIGLLFFTVTLIKRRNTQDPASTQDQSIRDSLNNSKISHTVCDYEEIKDPRCLPASETGVSTVYSTVHLPTDPLNTTQTVYDNVQLPTSPCDVLNPVYSTVPQHSSVKSAEDPAYATVNFCKNDAVTTAITKKEDSCDYATVKHVSGSG